MTRPLTLISSMATQKLLAELLDRYQSLTGQAVAAQAVGGVDAARRVAAGEVFDGVVLASNAIDDLVAAKRVLPGSRVDIVCSGISVAVPGGRPLPSIRDEAAVRAAVLGAASLCYSTGPSGTHLQRLFERWGLADQLRDRIVLAPAGTPVARLLAEGRAELGFQQTSELLNASGIQIIGPLPPEVQAVTRFSGGVCSASDVPARVRALLTWLASPATTEAKQRHGMDAADQVSA